MRTNTALTIYNKFYDSEAGDNAYQRTVIPAVSWENRKGRNLLATGGNIAADQAAIYIPMPGNTASYLALKAWQALEDKSSNWTLQRGDLVVKGEAVEDIDSEFTAKDLKAAYDDVLEISSVDAMDMGSPSMHHWQVGAK